MGYYNYYVQKNERALAYELGAEFLKEEPVFMCVGSSQVVADCFGPLVGEILTKKFGIKRVFGNLENNITQKNLLECYNRIKSEFPRNPIVIIDAAIGEEQNVGLIKFLSAGCVPAASNNAKVMGNYSLLGIVNVPGVNGLMFLRSVKFNMVLKMASFLSNSIAESLQLISKAAK